MAYQQKAEIVHKGLLHAESLSITTSMTALRNIKKEEPFKVQKKLQIMTCNKFALKFFTLLFAYQM